MFISSFNLLAPIEKKLAKICVFRSICIRQLQTYLLAWKQAKIINNAYGQIQNFCNRSVSCFLTYCISHIKVVAIATTEKISNGSSTQIDGLVSNYVSPEIHAFNSMWTIFPKFADNRCTIRDIMSQIRRLSSSCDAINQIQKYRKLL